MAGSPTRYPNGVGNRKPNDPMGMLIMPDPTAAHTFFDDFNLYTAAVWTLTSTGSGTAALLAGDGGLIILTNGAADDNNVFMQKTTEGFAITQGKKAWFKARFQTNDGTQSDVVFGLQVTDTTPLDVTDGIYLLKADDAATVQLIVRKNATTGSVATGQLGTLASATWTEWAFYYDGKQSVECWIDGTKRGTVDLTSTPTAFLPDTTLTISFGIQNGAAASKTLTVDYIFAATER